MYRKNSLNRYNTSLSLIPLNEGLFGIGAVSKPKQTLDKAFILLANTEELAEVISEYANYLIDKNGENVNKAVDSFIKIAEIAANDIEGGIKEAAKLANCIVLSVKNGIMGKYKTVKGNTKNLGNLIIFAVAFLIKLGVSGIDSGIKALSNLYNMLNAYLNEAWSVFTNKFNAAKDKVGNFINSANENIKLFLCVSNAVIYIVAKQAKGAIQYFKNFLGRVSEDVKNKSLFAIFVLRTWFGLKVQEVVSFTSQTFNNVKNTCVDEWNKLNKDVLKLWRKTTEAVTNWLNSMKLNVEALNTKIQQAVQNVKNSAINMKDNMASVVVKKAIKSLNKQNYPLDKVIDMVKSAYNESVYYHNGIKHINESKFRLSLNRNIKRYKML